MAYYHSKGAAKQLRSKMDLDKRILEQIHNLSVQRRYSSDEERREIDQRILELKRQLK